MGPRVRPSPYFESTLAHGVGAVTVYNHMMLPVHYGSIEADYWNLIDGVSVWDVGCQRQVEITGPDAASFTQYLITRDVTRIAPGRARYALVCQEDGGVLNDPVVLRLADDHFWLSLADSDILLWAKGVAHRSHFNVELSEPDVSPLQVQGPRSIELMRSLFGSSIDDLGFYHFTQLSLDGVSLLVSRTGWSGELGYEIYLGDSSKGGWLWDSVFEAGGPLGVRPGAPNNIRRMEAGLLSYGTDMDPSMNPIELGLDRFVDLEGPDDFIGKSAIHRIKDVGANRQRVGLYLDGDPIRQGPIRWWPVTSGSEQVGVVTSATWSPGLERNIAYGLVSTEHPDAGDGLLVAAPGGDRNAIPTAIPFVAPRY